MKILVTGAKGQLGLALARSLQAHELVLADSKRLDVTDLAAVRTAVSSERPEAVVNCAAWTDVDGAEADPEGAFRVNALAARNLALATQETSCTLLQVSTDYVFDGESERPYCEFDETSPLQVYGRSKLAGEDAVRTCNERHYIVRTAWLYSTTRKNFALTMRALAERDEVRVVADQFGSPTYVPHLAEGIARLLETGAYGTWHLAGRGQASWYELTRALYAALHITTPVHPVSTPEFPRPAPRPRFAPLTSVQSPELRLPAWEEGARHFARDLQ